MGILQGCNQWGGGGMTALLCDTKNWEGEKKLEIGRKKGERREKKWKRKKKEKRKRKGRKKGRKEKKKKKLTGIEFCL